MSTAARGEVSADDERVRVTTWTFPEDGSATGFHRHEFDYVVVPVSGGNFSVEEESGAVRQMTQEAGSPYQGTAGTAHDVVARGPGATFVEIELKRP